MSSARQRRARRVRVRLFGDEQRPRASVFRSLRTVRLQLIDDFRGQTLVAAESRDIGGRIEAARRLGREAGEKALALGIRQLVFDRGSYRYHGRVRAVAEGLREAGIQL
ncbi:MAG: 50S ribosomal protein L18 [Candidatus Andersenbacteria bacterium]|nr:50S ribosomal protein L18 [Candidatus Andersenbacteria bacterium]